MITATTVVEQAIVLKTNLNGFAQTSSLANRDAKSSYYAYNNMKKQSSENITEATEQKVGTISAVYHSTQQLIIMYMSQIRSPQTKEQWRLQLIFPSKELTHGF